MSKPQNNFIAKYMNVVNRPSIHKSENEISVEDLIEEGLEEYHEDKEEDSNER